MIEFHTNNSTESNEIEEELKRRDIKYVRLLDTSGTYPSFDFPMITTQFFMWRGVSDCWLGYLNGKKEGK